MNYNLKFIFSYIDCNNFKERDLILLRNFINGCRLGREIKFSQYGTIVFDENDKKHDFPIINELGAFTRGKTNAIIFDMETTSLNNVFNKCVIYQTVYKNESSYGYLMWNTESSDFTHQFNIEYDVNELVKHIYRTIMSLPNRYKIRQMLIESLSIKKPKNNIIVNI